MTERTKGWLELIRSIAAVVSIVLSFALGPAISWSVLVEHRVTTLESKTEENRAYIDSQGNDIKGINRLLGSIDKKLGISADRVERQPMGGSE